MSEPDPIFLGGLFLGGCFGPSPRYPLMVGPRDGSGRGGQIWLRVEEEDGVSLRSMLIHLTFFFQRCCFLTHDVPCFCFFPEGGWAQAHMGFLTYKEVNRRMKGLICTDAPPSLLDAVCACAAFPPPWVGLGRVGEGNVGCWVLGVGVCAGVYVLCCKCKCKCKM